ncbi:MAG: thioredoxin family protein [Bacteroidetes bacterium]|nr:thioredoxin family protein [Bacteroidota bacterium]
MKKFLPFLLFLIAGNFSFAQKGPVQFSFTSERKNDSLVYLVVKAKVDTGFFLFSAKPSGADDAFVSLLNLDSNSTRLLHDSNIVASANVKSVNDEAAGSTLHGYTDSATFSYPFYINSSDSADIKGTFSWLGKKGDEFPSGEEKFDVSVHPDKISVEGKTGEDHKSKGLWGFFLIGLVTGVIAAFTPCLYPLFPVTITYFMHHFGSRKQGIKNALVYSLCIILIYGIPTTLLTMFFGDTILYRISVHPVTNLLFFTIFVVFAISFFGLFEITLPSSWATKTDKLAGKKGYTGIFFMALTLVIVSFSCTGIFAGQLLSYLSSEGISSGPIGGMFGFGTGLALPFTLLALFPSLIHSMPKSGGWLNTVKVSFAFIELGLALKFLSNVDLIYKWRLLDREIFIAIWIVLAVLLGLYLLGKIKFYHDSEIKHITITRLFFVIASFTFALYLVPGLWGAPLKALSGWLPPEYTQDFNLLNTHSTGVSVSNNQSNNSAAQPPKLFADKISAPHGLTAYFDLDEGIAAAKALHKPMMLDFTGYSCANCRKMEAEVWSDPQVLQRIRDNFVLVSLYVDEPTELPADKKYTNSKGESINTYGDKNLDYEISKFGFNAQPLYMFTDANQNPLSDIKYGYDKDIQKFINHLDGIKAKFDALDK